MLASVAVLMLGFSLSERPWSVSVTPHASFTHTNGSRLGRPGWLLGAGSTVEAGFRPIPYARIIALAFGAIHQRNPVLGQSGLAGFLGGFEGLLPAGLVELAAGITMGGGWVDLRSCATFCPFAPYQNVLLVAPSVGVSVHTEELPWLSLGAIARLVYLLTGDYAVHVHFGLRVEARF